MTPTAVIAVSIILVVFLGIGGGSAYHYFKYEKKQS